MRVIAKHCILAITMMAFGMHGLTQTAETAKPKPMSTEMKIKIGTKTFTAALDESPTATAFKSILPLTVNMEDLNGNEKLFRFKTALPTKPFNPETIKAGDLMIYQSNTLVLFYKSFPTSYSYTRLGRISDPTGLAAAVGPGNLEVTFELVDSR